MFPPFFPGFQCVQFVYDRVVLYYLPCFMPEGQVVSVHMLCSHQAKEHAHLACWRSWKLFFHVDSVFFLGATILGIVEPNTICIEYREIDTHCEFYAKPQGFIMVIFIISTDCNSNVSKAESFPWTDWPILHCASAPSLRAREPTGGPRCTSPCRSWKGRGPRTRFGRWKIHHTWSIIIQNCWRSEIRGELKQLKHKRRSSIRTYWNNHKITRITRCGDFDKRRRKSISDLLLWRKDLISSFHGQRTVAAVCKGGIPVKRTLLSKLLKETFAMKLFRAYPADSPAMMFGTGTFFKMIGCGVHQPLPSLHGKGNPLWVDLIPEDRMQLRLLDWK